MRLFTCFTGGVPPPGVEEKPCNRPACSADDASSCGSAPGDPPAPEGQPRGRLVDYDDPPANEPVRSSHVAWSLCGVACPDDVAARAAWSVHQLTPIEVIGRGANSKVWLASDSVSGRKLAVKVYDLSKMSPAETAQLRSEAETHGSLRHPNILPLWAAFQDQVACYFVMECGGSDLYGWHYCSSRIPESTLATRVVAPLLRAIAYCHAKGIVHRDIKPENLLAGGPDSEIQVTDFGFAINMAKGGRPVTRLGTLEFMAPEVILSGYDEATGTPGAIPRELRDPYTEAVDVWSTGIVTYELLARHTPFVRANAADIALAIVMNDLQLPRGASAEACDFVRQCLRSDPVLRPSAAMLLDHPWIVRHTGVRPRMSRFPTLPMVPLRETLSMDQGPEGEGESGEKGSHVFVGSAISQDATASPLRGTIENDCARCTAAALVRTPSGAPARPNPQALETWDDLAAVLPHMRPPRNTSALPIASLMDGMGVNVPELCDPLLADHAR
ncbi:unnamed protein product [Pedinophyceae sp. YPF-701]|nr:unnamed protein product [Pedinophyceae sp. YPF-701]